MDLPSITVVLVGPNDVHTISVTTWKANSTNSTTFVSNVVEVTVTTLDGSPLPETSNIDSGIGLVFDVNAAEDGGAFRQQLSCQFFNRTTSEWSTRGMHLRGIEVHTDDNKFQPAGICITSHLTQFAMADDSETVSALESKIDLIGSRFETLSRVNLLHSDTEVNPLVLGLFIGTTVLFGTIVICSNATRRKEAVSTANSVFIHYGRLRRPAVVGGDELRAILRGWLKFGQILGMFCLQSLSGSPYLAHIFRWTHNSMVYTSLDKAYVLYSATLSTFLVQAFNLDTESEGTPTIGELLSGVFFGAILTNVFFFPVQYFLPFMTANVSSITTNTAVTRSVVTEQWKIVKRRLLCKTKREEAKDAVRREKERKKTRLAEAVKTWWDTMVDSKIEDEMVRLEREMGERLLRARTRPRRSSTQFSENSHLWVTPKRVPKVLRFLSCDVPLPSRSQIQGRVAEELSLFEIEAMDELNDADVARGAMAIQRIFFARQRRRHLIRQAEFDAWYNDCRRERVILRSIVSVFISVLAGFALIVCLLVSAAFTDEQCIKWVVAVAQSIAMQIVVTAPLVGVAVFLVKLLITHLLIKGHAAERKVVPLNINDERQKKQDTQKHTQEQPKLYELTHIVPIASVKDKRNNVDHASKVQTADVKSLAPMETNDDGDFDGTVMELEPWNIDRLSLGGVGRADSSNNTHQQADKGVGRRRRRRRAVQKKRSRHKPSLTALARLTVHTDTEQVVEPDDSVTGFGTVSLKKATFGQRRHKRIVPSAPRRLRKALKKRASSEAWVLGPKTTAKIEQPKKKNEEPTTDVVIPMDSFEWFEM